MKVGGIEKCRSQLPRSLAPMADDFSCDVGALVHEAMRKKWFGHKAIARRQLQDNTQKKNCQKKNTQKKNTQKNSARS